MSVALDTASSMIDRIRHDLVGLKMPRALEALDHVVRRLEHGELSALEAIDILLSEELTLRENSRIKTALRMGRLATIKTLAGFDFSFQPSLDKDRIFTLAQLCFIERCEAVHFLGPPGTGKSHLATALGVEAVKAGKSVYFTTLADLIAALSRAEREGRLQERIRFFCRPSLLIVDQDRNRRVVAVQPLCRKCMGFDPFEDRIEYGTASADAIGHRRQAERNAFAFEALDLTVKRQMLAELVEQDHRQKIGRPIRAGWRGRGPGTTTRSRGRCSGKGFFTGRLRVKPATLTVAATAISAASSSSVAAISNSTSWNSIWSISRARRSAFGP